MDALSCPLYVAASAAAVLVNINVPSFLVLRNSFFSIAGLMPLWASWTNRADYEPLHPKQILYKTTFGRA
jgi:hypothetical protein